MRSLQRRFRTEDEEESVFVSMTDMTVSFLFIVMILLAFFASRFARDDMVPEVRLDDALAELATTEQKLEEVSVERDALRAELEEARELISKLERSLRLVTQDRVRAERLASSLGQDLEQAEDRLDSVRAEVARLRTDLEGARSEVELLQEQLRQALADSDATRTSLAAAEAALAELNARIEVLTAENEDLRRIAEEVAALEEQLEQARRMIADLREQLADPLEEYLSAVAQERRDLLVRLRDAIRRDFPDLRVVISSENDALRFQGEGLFNTASRRLAPDKRQMVERIAVRLDELLPCYTLGERSAYRSGCNPGAALIEAVQIEGHTDDRGNDLYNLELSTGRALATYAAMTERADGILEHRNLDSEPVLSVAGYGENRPIASNETMEGQDTNRRIDLRFIMFTPSRSEEIEIIRARLAADGEGAY